MANKKDILFKNVEKTFGKTKVIEHLDLHIREGERLILLALPDVENPQLCG